MKTTVMVDFNDDPVNVRVKYILRASGSSEMLFH
jgi:hypothetical protein